MSWQLGAFSVLFLALLGGFAWYERNRPDARVVALVASLAALAALGRIAFAAFPNVKPTTDIVLISGYSLGAGPGFAVGALAGLVSNFFFGQGPWTPWQMAAWGATGVLGAGLAAVTRQRIHRLPLALVCAVVGFGFTATLDVGDWVTYSDHSVGALGIYVGKGLGFDGIHAAGCLVFALAFGPALIRSLTRFAERLSVTWRLPGGAVAPVMLGAVAAAALLGAAPAHAASAQAGYLEAAQNNDGGLGAAPGQPSGSLYAGWAALGLASEGVAPASVSRAGHSLAGYIAQTGASTSNPGDVERTILALVASGLNPHNVGGSDLVARLEGDFRGDGSVSDQTNLTAFAILALRAAGAGAPGSAVAWLARQQDSDGGFNYGTAGGQSDIDDTGAALEALAGSGDAGAVGRAVRFLHAQQNGDGGFPSSPGQSSNAQSTAWAMQGLDAIGIDPASFHAAGGTPDHYLQSLIAPDGHVRYSSGADQTPVWVTGEAMMALAGKPLPLAGPAGGGRSSGGAAPGSRGAGSQRHAGRGSRRAHAAPTVTLALGPVLANQLATGTGVLMALMLAPVGAS